MRSRGAMRTKTPPGTGGTRIARRSPARSSRRWRRPRVEYVYSHYRYTPDDNRDDVDVWERHRVVKRTAQRIYIDRRAERTDIPPRALTADDLAQAETMVLDRAAFERDGQIRPAREQVYLGRTFYRDADAIDGILTASRRVSPPVAAALAALGLDVVAGAVDVEKAYRRLALEQHPDVGGDAESFMETRRAYDLAMSSFGRS